MLSYYGYTISPNQLETGEGFLICRNVPVARIGEQDYLGTEIGLDREEIVKVKRPAEEVFSDAALASFEGKPVTNNHPPVLLDPENVGMYEMGHIQNVRQGRGEWDGYVVGDLHIHDRQLIEDIRNGKRQVSCGYECEYTDNGDGTYTQSNIRGNHVAVVESGRAGNKAAIMDSNIKKAEKAERKVTMTKKSTFLKIFGAAANGKSDEELTQMAMDAADALEEEKVDVEEKVEDADPIAELSAKLDRLIELMTPAEPEIEEKEEVKEELDEVIEALEKEEEKEELSDEEAQVVEAEEMTDGCKAIGDAEAAHILKTVRPTLAAIADEKVPNPKYMSLKVVEYSQQ